MTQSFTFDKRKHVKARQSTKKGFLRSLSDARRLETTGVSPAKRLRLPLMRIIAGSCYGVLIFFRLAFRAFALAGRLP